jgi:imidazolonepropionase
MRVFSDIDKCYTLQSVADAEGRASQADALRAIERAVIVEDEGRIVWLGSHKDFEGQKSRLNLSRKTESISLAGTTVLPAFTECHTHLVFAGDRSGEFELRNQGVSYQEISKQGGGILSTVQATCEATESDLLRLAQQRADRFVQQGATALEVKSGYGLSHESEIKMLKVARAIRGPKVMATYLGPHSVPSGSSKTDYLEQILDRTLPEVAKLGVADRADIFIENDFFTVEDGRRFFARGQRVGFQPHRSRGAAVTTRGGRVLAAQSQAALCGSLGRDQQ